LAFLHIPKTAGVTLRYALINALKALNCHYVDPQNRSSWSNTWLTPAQCSFMATGLDGSEFPLLIEAAVSGVALTYTTGHDPFGVCSFMARGCRYATVLRDPVERLLSHYHYMRNLGSINNSLDVFLEKIDEDGYGEGMLSNIQTRYVSGTHFWHKVFNSEVCGQGKFGRSPNLTLCGVHRYDKASASERAEILELAKRHLVEDFALVGFVEDMEDFVTQVRLRTYIPLAPLKYIRSENRAVFRTSTHMQATEPALVAKILQQQTMDLELYDWAVQRFGSPRLQKQYARVRQQRSDIVDQASVHLRGISPQGAAPDFAQRRPAPAPGGKARQPDAFAFGDLQWRRQDFGGAPKAAAVDENPQAPKRSPGAIQAAAVPVGAATGRATTTSSKPCVALAPLAIASGLSCDCEYEDGELAPEEMCKTIPCEYEDGGVPDELCSERLQEIT